MKFKEWLSIWLENYAKLTVKNRTCARYAEIIKCHINSALGDYELETLDSITLQKYIAGLLEHGNLRTGKALSANSVNAVIAVLQGSLRVSWENIGVKQENCMWAMFYIVLLFMGIL